MEKQQFKTTINCNNCVRAVRGFLEEVPGVEHWEVDITSPGKILTVEGGASIEAIVDAVEEAGFDIEPVAADAH